MTDNTDNSAPLDSSTDAGEIKLSDLMLAVWRVRIFVLVSVVFSAFAIIGFIALARVGMPSQQVYQTAVKFVFPDVERDDEEEDVKKSEGEKERERNKRYPNGRIFSISDLVAPDVLQKVYDQNNLAELGIDPGRFAASVSVHPFAPIYEEVVGRYRSRLSNKKLSFIERQTIEKLMRRELDDLAGKGALVRLTLNSRFGIIDSLGEKIVNDIVSVWSKFSIEQLGVLRLPDLVIGTEQIDINFLKMVDIPSGLFLLEDSIEELKGRINKMRESSAAGIKNRTMQNLTFSGIDSVLDIESGYTPRDLMRQLTIFNNYRLKNLAGRVFSSRLIEQPSTILLTFRNRLEDLKFKRDAILSEAAAYNNALSTYTSRGTVPASTIKSSADIPANIPPASSIPQLSGGFLDRIVSLTVNRRDMEFRQNIVDRQIELRQLAIDVDLKIARLKQFTDALEKYNRLEQSGEPTTDGITRKQAKDNLIELAIAVNDYWKITGRLFASLSEKRLSYDGHLYVSLPLAASDAASSNHPVFNSRTFILAFAALVAIAIFSLFIGLLRQMLRGRIQQD